MIYFSYYLFFFFFFLLLDIVYMGPQQSTSGGEWCLVHCPCLLPLLLFSACYVLPELLSDSDENPSWLLLCSYFMASYPCLSLTFSGPMFHPKEIRAPSLKVQSHYQTDASALTRLRRSAHCLRSVSPGFLPQSRSTQKNGA